MYSRRAAGKKSRPHTVRGRSRVPLRVLRRRRHYIVVGGRETRKCDSSAFADSQLYQAQVECDELLVTSPDERKQQHNSHSSTNMVWCFRG